MSKLSTIADGQNMEELSLIGKWMSTIVDITSMFHLVRPLWLLALIPAAILFVKLRERQQLSTQWTGLINPKLLPYLLDGEFTPAQKTPIYGLLALWCIATIALAGPAWEKKPQPMQKDVSAMVILWDMSPSMNAQDIKPSRLTRSRLKLIDLLDMRKEGLTALIAYSGDAHVVTPLTDDSKTIKSLLPGLTPQMMPVQGSDPESAFALAHELLKETGIQKGDIVFVTDGIARDALEELKSQARQGQHRVTVWGIGTAEGAPIPMASGGFAKSRNGDIIVAKLDEVNLSDTAVALGGLYIPFANDKRDIENIAYFGLNDAQEQEQQDERIMDQWLEHGHLIALLMLPFAALAFRRGWILCLCLGISLSPDSQALSWQDFWQTQDQQARELLKQEENEAAAATFKNPDWKASAEYLSGNYEAAHEHFAQGSDASAKYNYGNTLTHLGKYDEAIEAYNEALALAPDFKEAQQNKSIAEQLKAMQEQQQQNQQNQDQQSQDQQNQDQQNQQQGDNSEQSQDQQSQEQQSQQQQSEDQQSSEQQSSEQQNSEQQSDQSQSQQDNEQQDSEQESGEQKDQALSEQQKQALDQQYKQEQEQQAQQGEQEEPQEEQAQQQAQLQQQEQQESQEQQNQEQQAQAMMQQMTDEEKEQQQALEQWLRRVPDDPSGLLRQKFRYEHQKRRREMQSRSLRNPGVVPDERW